MDGRKAGTGVNISIIVVLAIVALTWMTFSLTGQVALKTSETKDFAKCVGEKAILYGHRNSRDTIEQTSLFGSSARYLQYIECSPLAQTYGNCVQHGIGTYPTWLVNGELHEGVHTLEEISEFTGCPL